ncbi:MAG: aminotransferase family protein [Chloroflexota bacterium]
MTEKGYDAEALAKNDVEHVLHPFTPLKAHSRQGPVVIVEGKGIWVHDAAGQEYLDGTAGLWCVNVGHGRKEIAEAAAVQMAKLAFSPMFWGFAHPVAINLATRLAEITPFGLNHFFFTSGGSESIESALKIARYYWYVQDKPQKIKFVSRLFGYHGVSYGALSATGIEMIKHQFGPMLTGFLHIVPPYCYRCFLGKTYPECEVACAWALAHVIDQEDPETVAAFVAEPVQGSGGLIVPPPEYLPIVRRICTERNVLLIADEVITGFYRTGPAFGVMHSNVTPDLMALAKGISSGYVPLGAVAVSDDIYDTVASSPALFAHGFTYSGHPVACAAALKNLDILVGENLGANAAEMGAYLLNRLNELRELPYVGDVRGQGLLGAVELVEDKSTRAGFDPAKQVGAQVAMAARMRGLIVRPILDIIVMSPPLVVTRSDIDTLVERLGQAIKSIRV